MILTVPDINEWGAKGRRKESEHNGGDERNYLVIVRISGGLKKFFRSLFLPEFSTWFRCFN